MDPKLIALEERRTFSAEMALELGDLVTAEARLAFSFGIGSVADIFLRETLVIVVIFVIAFLLERRRNREPMINTPTTK